MNRLSHEKSPYLLQHANNPVDWYPWGDEAFEKASRENLPIFLSVGYSTCYWCHVMEREVFENEHIAGIMNRNVVSVKVDREERPDIDRIYMSALQAMSGSGGWPMSMFLTPDRKPFFGATYIPPTARHGRPGFVEILGRIGEIWKTDREKILESGSRIGEYLARLAETDEESRELTVDALDAAFAYFSASFDGRHGGFGGAPKFPRPVVLNFLHRHYARTQHARALELSLQTLRHMANGGMFDHLGGGFHRYSTDDRWHVPHFEKMLYDQAQLATSYLEAYQITHDRFYSDVAGRTLEYVLSDLSHPGGGFTSAEDAESLNAAHAPGTKEEGAFYVWTANELETVLTKEETRVACGVFDVQKNGNVLEDPHGIFRGKNILHVVASTSDVARHLGLPEPVVAELRASATSKLLLARNRRPRPHLDDKVLTSWNGLMISAFSLAHRILHKAKYLEAAEGAASFILAKLQDKSTNELFHRYRDGEAGIEGQLEDYAFLIQGLLDLYEASFTIGYLNEAITLQEVQNSLFLDRDRGGFYDTSGRDSTVLVRTKEWYDGAEPSGNAIAILNLLRLAQFTNNESYQSLARRSLSCFGGRMLEAPQATPQLLNGLSFALKKPTQVIVAGAYDHPMTQALLAVVYEHYLPHKVLMLADGSVGQERLAKLTPFVGTLRPINNQPTAYLCEDFSCLLPTTEPQMLSESLTQLSGRKS